MKPDWLENEIKPLDEGMRQLAQARQEQLTKPQGSLGRLEELAIQLAAMQGTVKPSLERVRITVFAGDHGVAEEGVSLFPQAVTAEMIKNFARGGAAISVLAKEIGAELEVVDCGAVIDVGPLTGVVSDRAAAGTANFCNGPAMTEDQLVHALEAGRRAALRAIEGGAQLFIGGEMGIANTTPATALLCSLEGMEPDSVTGPGTGLDSAGVKQKVEVIRRALQTHEAVNGNALETLRCLGGFEIAALAGAYISAAQHQLPVMIDGFISSAAALTAVRLCPAVRQWLFFAHASAEPGHKTMMAVLDAEPLLDLGMRLGEGSGAAVAVSILRAAVTTHSTMATFAEAGVSEAE